jgi:hypothetical protein
MIMNKGMHHLLINYNHHRHFSLHTIKSFIIIINIINIQRQEAAAAAAFN